MRHTIRNLSPRAEFWTIVCLAFGFFIFGSTRAFFTQETRLLTNRWAIGLVLFEGGVLLLIAAFARERGWSLLDLGLRPSWMLTFGGIGLYLGTNFVTNVVYAIVKAGTGAEIPSALGGGSLSYLSVIAVAIVNPIFEETLVTGYVVSATARHGAAFAVTASTLIRLLYHTYQGPIAAICILPLGLIFAAVYWRNRELWPLIVAHGLMNLGLSYYAV